MQIARLEVEVVPQAAVQWWSVPGPSLRGALKSASLAWACPRVAASGGAPVGGRSPCPAGCAERTNCLYGHLHPADKPVHPWALQVPQGSQRSWSANQAARFSLALFGARAIGDVPRIVAVLEAMGQRGVGQGHIPFRVAQISSVGDEAPNLLWRPGVPALAPSTVRFEQFQPVAEAEQLRIDFLTPAALLRHGTPVASGPAPVPFAALMHNLLNRLSTLSHHYGPAKYDWDYPGLLRAAEAIHCARARLQRGAFAAYSSRQGETYPKQGIIGWATYGGVDLARFWPYLRFGEYTGVGGGTAYGMGHYQVRWVASADPR